MMSTVKEVNEGSTLGDSGELNSTLDLKSTVQRTAARVFHVSDLTTPSDIEGRKAEAIRLVGIGIGDSHPTLSNAKVTGRSCRVMGDTYFEVSIQYASTEQDVSGGSSSSRVAIGGGLKQVTTNTDKDFGSAIYYKPGENGEPPFNDPETKSSGYEAQITEALHTLRFSRRRVLTQKVAEDNARKWINTINSDAWHGGAKWQWRCMGVNYDSEDKTDWTESLDFEWDSEYHNPVVAYIDPATGRPPTDITAPGKAGKPGEHGNGTYRLNWYDQLPFGATFQGL